MMFSSETGRVAMLSSSGRPRARPVPGRTELAGERLATAGAALLRRTCAHVLVEAHPELRRSLEDVEQLPEGQPEQGEDDGDGVEDGEEAERVALQPGVAGGQHQPGDAHREEKEQRQDVLGEL